MGYVVALVCMKQSLIGDDHALEHLDLLATSRRFPAIYRLLRSTNVFHLRTRIIAMTHSNGRTCEVVVR
jgi:hypothetical protein